MNEPKILYFDIETSPAIVEVWGCGKQYVGSEQIRKERKVLCICYKWAGKKNKVIDLQLDLSKHKLYAFDDDADKELLKKFSKVFNEADLVVAHNGRSFDLARLRARLVKYGLPDMAPVLFDDSYVLAKDKDFTSHKLDYLCRYLGMPGKTHTTRKLWTDVMDGSKKALSIMTKYCHNDVTILEKVYVKLRPYSKSNLNLSMFYEDKDMCPSCGGSLIRKGFTLSNTGKKQRFRCTRASCGKWFSSGKNLVVGASEYPR